MEKAKLNKLKKQLKGHQSKVAAKTGMSIAAVSRVLNGEYNSPEIIKAAIEVRDEERYKNELLMSQI